MNNLSKVKNIIVKKPLKLDCGKEISNFPLAYETYGKLNEKRDKVKHWTYEVENIGFNFRLNDFQSALGISQLSKLKKFISNRKKIFNNYMRLLSKIREINLPNHDNRYISSHHLFIVNLKYPNLHYKEKLIKHMLKNKVIIQYHYIPIYKFKVFRGKYIKKNSEIYFQSAISLPIYYGLTFKQQKYVVLKLKEFFKKN